MRHLKSSRTLSLALMFAALPGTAWAWNAEGHQLVGSIADHLLVGTPAAAQVKQILGGMNLQTVAVWPDCAKGVSSKDDSHFAYKLDPRFAECKPFETTQGQAAMVDFVSRNWKQCGSAHGNELCHNQYHYADVASVHDHYQDGYVGTHSHDIVHAINAAIAVLRGQTAPAPFSIRDKTEALYLLAHYVGDIHQPLHVTALYLDAQGQPFDPDAGGNPADADTVGGNSLIDGSQSLHHEWDAIPTTLIAADAATPLLDQARAVAATQGDDPASWSQAWASETVRLAPQAFGGLSFTPKTDPHPPKWTVAGHDAAYETRRDALQTQQVIKAGARLAQILQAVWPATGGMGGSKASGYLDSGKLPNVTLWLPAAPAHGSAAEAADIEVFNDTRAQLQTPRGQQAAEDDVFDPPQVVTRFSDALGFKPDAGKLPRLLAMMTKAQADANALVAPIKHPVAEGGRVRPFVAFSGAPTCLNPVDMAGHRDSDLNTFHLAASGSYPSTHALIGLLWAMTLAEALPERADALLARGLSFGESRVVCGFHYASDVEAGRLAAAALYARLHADAGFVKDFAAVRKELAKARQP